VSWYLAPWHWIFFPEKDTINLLISIASSCKRSTLASGCSILGTNTHQGKTKVWIFSGTFINWSSMIHGGPPTPQLPTMIPRKINTNQLMPSGSSGATHKSFT
jgi:hypothetical protein